ncbi:MAG: hypothetical protein ACOYM3_09650 [Terrimicrobiaceae bacterium]
MKPIFILFLLIAFAAAGRAQTQERKLVDRVMKPDMSLGNPLQNKSYSGGTSLGEKTATTADSSYWGVKDARIKEYPLTRSFMGIKNPWFGNKVMDTKSADLWSKYAIKNADREVSVKKAEAVGYYDATKSAYFGSPVVPTRVFIPRADSQGAVSQITEKINNKMTIDEVRELLNKPR